MLQNSSHRFGSIAILLHWLGAALIVFLFGLGLYMVDLGYYDDWYHQAPALHISLGLLLLALTLLRLIWRWLNTTPPAPSAHSVLQRRGANAMVFTLYLLSLAIIVSGYFITTAEGKAASFFDWLYLPATLQFGPADVDLMGELHYWAAWLIIVLASLHSVAALYHHFVDKDDTLRRILPARKTRS